MQPPFEGGVAGGVGALDAHIGPFVQQGAVEAFDLAVPGGRRGGSRLWVAPVAVTASVKVWAR